MNPRLFLGILLLCLSNDVEMVRAADGMSKPNLLIITVDDMSADSLGAFGCKLPDTSPNIDRLATQGMRFERAHVVVGNCMPSRNVMWSGLYPHNTRVEGFYSVPDAKHPHLADLFRDAGYFTAIQHKVSHSTPYSPYPAWDLNLDTSEDGARRDMKAAASYGAATRQGIAAARSAGKPFCLMINVADPHKPFFAEGQGGATVPDENTPSRVFTPEEVPIPGFLFDDPVVRKELSHYYSSVRRADDCVGEILAGLDASGLRNQTIIVFLSDHGMPLPFAKTQLYHHSSHTSLMFVVPGKTKAGSSDSEHMISAVDLLPTLLELTGVTHPSKMDGRSFAPLLEGKQQDGRDFVLKEHNENAGGSRDPMRAIQTRQYLYLFNPWSNGKRIMATATTGTPTYRRLAQLAKTDPQLAARHQLYQHRAVEELYDVARDPDCVNNLIDSEPHQAELASLRKQLEASMAGNGDPMLTVFRNRSDAAAREAYVVSQEKEAESRGDRKAKQRAEKAGKRQGKGKRKIRLNEEDAGHRTRRVAEFAEVSKPIVRSLSRVAEVVRMATPIFGIVANTATTRMAADTPRRPRPNTLLIVLDDQGYGDASCYGAKDLKTPNLDSLAANGIRFTQFRVNPLCAPTRASLFTGQSSLESGMWRGPSQKTNVERAIGDDVRLLPQFLKEAGYATGIFGKWHLGYESPNLPADRGFDEFVGFLGGSHPYVARRNGRILKDDKPYSSDEHLTDILADHAEDFIRRNAEGSFFCYLPFNAVHGPLRSEDRPSDSAKPEWLSKYSELPPNRRDYCAVLSHADERIGRLIDLIRELGIDGNTLVICVSDNGAIVDKYPGNNGSFRGAKGTTYEGGIRVPAIMTWPVAIPPRSISNASATHFDIFSTVLDAAQIEIPKMNGQHPVHGISLMQHLQSGGKTKLPDRYLFWDLYGKMAALHGDWKIVASIENHHGKWDRALEQIEQTQFELYNLAADPKEENDLAAQHPEIHGDLKGRYIQWFRAATR